MHKSIVDQIEVAMEQRPTLVLSMWSPAYAATSGDTPGVQAGVRGVEDFELDMQGVTVADAQYLEQKFAPVDVHYLVDDNSADSTEFAEAVRAFEAHSSTPPTCTVSDLFDILASTMRNGNFDVTIDGATWRVVV